MLSLYHHQRLMCVDWRLPTIPGLLLGQVRFPTEQFPFQPFAHSQLPVVGVVLGVALVKVAGLNAVGAMAKMEHVQGSWTASSLFEHLQVRQRLPTGETPYAVAVGIQSVPPDQAISRRTRSQVELALQSHFYRQRQRNRKQGDGE